MANGQGQPQSDEETKGESDEVNAKRLVALRGMVG